MLQLQRATSNSVVVPKWPLGDFRLEQSQCVVRWPKAMGQAMLALAGSHVLWTVLGGMTALAVEVRPILDGSGIATPPISGITIGKKGRARALLRGSSCHRY